MEVGEESLKRPVSEVVNGRLRTITRLPETPPPLPLPVVGPLCLAALRPATHTPGPDLFPLQGGVLPGASWSADSGPVSPRGQWLQMAQGPPGLPHLEAEGPVSQGYLAPVHSDSVA